MKMKACTYHELLQDSGQEAVLRNSRLEAVAAQRAILGAEATFRRTFLLRQFLAAGEEQIWVVFSPYEEAILFF